MHPTLPATVEQVSQNAVRWSSGFSLGRLTVAGTYGAAPTVAIRLFTLQERRLKPEFQRA
jgi:hypothetical protein